jgi:CubicO group peptidase (beta-lactamase class C family)
VRPLLIILGVAALDAAALAGQPAPPFDDGIRRAIDDYVRSKIESAHLPGVALAIVEGDQVVYLAGYGVADPMNRPVTPQTPFLIGSITKSFTALATLQLADAGRIDLDAPVQRYLPWFHTADRAASARITVRQLLTMTSGLPQLYEPQVWSPDDGDLEDAVRLLGDARPHAPPGTSFNYSNSNYETLGLVIARASGQSYEAYLRTHILGPLDMQRSFTSQDEAIRSGMATGHQWWFGIPVATTIPYVRAELPAGYLISSAEDMSHFIVAELNEGRFEGTSVLSPRMMAFRHTPPAPDAYGLGWEAARVNGHLLLNHDGGTATFQASVFIDPAARIGVFVVTNVINALDTFSSPHGASILNGAMTRGMAMRIISLARGESPPEGGLGHERVTLIFDFVLLVLTVLLASSLARMPRRRKRLRQRPPADLTDYRLQVCKVAVLNFWLAVVLAYLTLVVPAWRVIQRFQPDLAWWLDIVAMILLVKGIVELIWLRRVRPSGRDSRRIERGRRANEHPGAPRTIPSASYFR